MKKFWCLFFMFWPIIGLIACAISPSMNWGFPYGLPAGSPLGERIDGLYYMILALVLIVFTGTQIGLGYVLWRGSEETDERAWYTHGSHSLEVIWSIVPAGILLFIALYQMDVWAEYRIQDNKNFPNQLETTVAEVTARQFEWRIRYPAPDRKFATRADLVTWLRNPQSDDLYSVNDIRVPAGKKVTIHLRTEDVQHSFFVPVLRIKQDAVPGKVIPVWFEATRADQYELLCAELCGWGHYKMKARVWAQSQEEYDAYLKQLQHDQFDDGVSSAENDED